MQRIGLVRRGLTGVAGLALMAVLAGCGSKPGPPAIGVSVSPATVTLIGGAGQTFTATVTNDSTNAGVTWTASVGTITSAGVYNAPSPVPVGVTTATITATSVASTSQTGTAVVTLTPIGVSVAPPTATLVAGATQQFGATVTADMFNGGVTWTASVGSITPGGLYTAPTPVATATATITATSVTDHTKMGTAVVTLTPISVSVAPPTPTLIGNGTQTFTATVTGDGTLNAGVTWAASIGSITQAGVYTAPAVITTTSATVTATSKTDTTKSGTATVTLTPISVAIAPLTPAAMIGGATQAFTATVTADGSNSGVTWSVTGGGGFSANSTASGVATTYTAANPVTAATAVVTATSVKDPTKSASVTVTLTPISLNPINPATIGLGVGGTQAFTDTVNNDGSNSGVSWSIGSGVGSLSASSTTGVTYNAPGTLIGTVTTVTLTATSIKDPTKSTTATITLNPIGVTFSTATAGVLMDSGQTLTLNAAVANDTSGSGANFAASGAGTVAPPSATGNSPATVLTATGSVASSVTVTATSIKDPSRSATTSSIAVSPALAITTAAGPFAGGTLGTVYGGATVATSGGSGAKTFAIATGALPAGLGISPTTGVISGTPTGSAGTATFTVKATDSATTPVSVTSGTYTIAVVAPPLVWTAPTTGTDTYTVGTAITPIALTTTGGTGAITYTVNSGTLPNGLQIVGSQVTGTPTAPTVVSGNVVSFLATDSATPTHVTQVSANVTFVVNPVPLVITSTSLPTGTVGAAYSYQLTSTGGTGTISWSLISGSLTGTGLSLSSAGLLTGTPTTTVSGLNLTFQAQDSAANQQQTVNKVLTLTENNQLTITTATTLTSGTVNTAYSQNLASAGGSGTGYTYTVVSGTGLSAVGLSLSSGGAITGTPNAAETAGQVTVKVTDSASNTATATLTLTVFAALSVSTTSVPSGVVGTAYSNSVAATGGSGTGYTWTVTSGTGLSAVGLSLSSGGAITGTPGTTESAVAFTVKVTDSLSNTASATLTMTVNPTLTVSTGSVPNGTVGTGYSQQLAASGGTGTGYTWTVTSGTGLSAVGLGLSSGGLITGTPSTSETSTSFTVKVTDSGGNTASATLGMIVNFPTLTVTTSSVPAGTVGTSYSQQLTASGGTGSGYSWTVTSGTGLSAVGLGLSSGGLITGTPSGTESSVSFTVKVTDSAANTATATLSMTVNPVNAFTVSGQIASANGCGAALSGITVSINTSTVQTTTTNSSGNFSFTNIPNGTYTLTPSITGPTSVFYPATQSVTVNGGNMTNLSFSGTLGYTVSGTVSYSGSKTGRVYLVLSSNNCGGSGTQGTSLSAAGAYTIHGVAPGSYNLDAYMDTLGYEQQNAADPESAMPGPSVTVSSSNLTGQNVSLTDPSTVTVTTAPTIQGVGGFNNGAIAQFGAVTNNSIEVPTSYTLQWSTTSAFTTVTGFQTFPAYGKHTNIWLLNSSKNPTMTNGSVYYFRAYGSSAGTTTGPMSAVFGPVTIGAPTGGNMVTGSVTFTGTATGPLYAGYYSQTTGFFYGEYFANPVSAQAFSVQVPTGSNYILVGILDQNNNGILDFGDISDVNNIQNAPAVTISGTTSNQTLTLPSANGLAVVTTQSFKSTNSGVTTQQYYLNLQVGALSKVPVAVSLASGPNVVAPMDLGACGVTTSGCGQGFQISFSLGTVAPNVGDTYSFNVTYSDGTTGVLTASVTAVLNAFATSLSPTTGTSVMTTPTFMWVDPVNASNYLYEFELSYATAGNIWQIPGNNSNLNGFTSSITSVPWSTTTDPTGAANPPTVTALTVGTNYQWQVSVYDTNGNVSVTQVYYQP